MRGKKLEPSRDVGVWAETPNQDPLQPRLRLYSPLERAALKTQVDKWLSLGYIEPSRAWVKCNPLFVEKKDGSLRTCIDYRPINAVIEDWEWPLPKIREIRHRLVGTSWYAKIDLKDAFHRIRVDPASRPLTAFQTHFGTFQFTRMPFGLNTAPSTYQRFLDWVLHSVKEFLINYVDDILVFATTLRQLRSRVRQVLKVLARWQIDVNTEKSELETKEVVFVGLRIRNGNIGASLPIRPFSTPTTVKEWQSALGFANCFRDFVPNFSDLTAGLYPGAHQIEASLRQERWKQLWRQLHHCLTLQSYDDRHDADLYLDASLRAVGAVLTQNGKVCAIFSRGLSQSQTRYSATDREHLALMLGVECFRVFIQSNRKLRVHTDHAALLNRQEDRMTPRQLRWKTRIQAVTTNIQHIAGVDNPADYWSRWGWEEGGDGFFCL